LDASLLAPETGRNVPYFGGIGCYKQTTARLITSSIAAHTGGGGRIRMDDQFRLMLISHDAIASMQAIPIRSPAGDARVFPVRGKQELLSFISRVGIDSVVTTRQLGRPEQLGECKPPVMEYTYNMLPQEQIVGTIKRHFATTREYIYLGSTKLSSSEAFQRMTDWVEDQHH
jgi:hypothetical protein